MAKKKKNQNESDWVSNATRGLENLLAFSRSLERLLVDVVAAYIPLFASVIPATMTFISLDQVLHFPLPVCFVGAAVVEFLGLSTVSTTVQFVDYNAVKGMDDQPAPTRMAVGTAIFYLAIVLIVNVLLDNAEPVNKAAKALLSTMGIAGAITISLRSQHARRVAAKLVKDEKAETESTKHTSDETAYRRQVSAEKRQQKHELKLKELELKASETQPEPVKVSEKVVETITEKPDTFGKWKTWRKVPHEEKLKIARMTMEQVVEVYGVEERTAYHWLEYAKRDTGIVGEVAQLQNELVFNIQEPVEV